MSTVWLVIRIVNVFVYCGIVSGLIMHWRSLKVPSMPGFRWGLLGLVAAGAYATVEIVFQGQPGGPRLIPLAVSLAVLFTACYAVPVRHLLDRLRNLRQHRRST